MPAVKIAKPAVTITEPATPAVTIQTNPTEGCSIPEETEVLTHQFTTIPGATPDMSVMIDRVPPVLVQNLRIPEEYSLEETGISQSLLLSAQSCRRLFLFEINRWISRKREKNTAYGSMVHDALDLIYRMHMEGRATIDDLPDVARTSIEAHKMPALFSAEEVEKNKAIADSMLRHYLVWYRKDFTENRFEAVEERFTIKWHRYTIRGKIDGRFRDKNEGRWHIEHKNYSRISEDTMPLVLSFDLQNLTYMLSDLVRFKQLLSGVLYNILRKPDIRKQMPVSEIDGYISAKIKEDPRHYFIRYEIPYTKEDLAVFQRELSVKLGELNQAIKAAKRWPNSTISKFYKNECSCEGKYTCDFLNACSSGHMVGYEQKATIFEELKDEQGSIDVPGPRGPDQIQNPEDPHTSAPQGEGAAA